MKRGADPSSEATSVQTADTVGLTHVVPGQWLRILQRECHQHARRHV